MYKSLTHSSSQSLIQNNSSVYRTKFIEANQTFDTSCPASTRTRHHKLWTSFVPGNRTPRPELFTKQFPETRPTNSETTVRHAKPNHTNQLELTTEHRRITSRNSATVPLTPRNCKAIKSIKTKVRRSDSRESNRRSSRAGWGNGIHHASRTCARNDRAVCTIASSGPLPGER